MSRVIVYVGVATVAFIFGIASNWSINTFGGIAVDKFYSDTEVVLNAFNILPGAGTISLSEDTRCPLVVSVTADGTLGLNNLQLGTLNDTSDLKAALRRLFELREEMHVYAPPELSLSVPKYRQIERTICIKAPRSLSYGEVADLIAVVRETGADPVGLIVENSQP